MAFVVTFLVTLLLASIFYIEARKLFINRKLKNYDEIRGAPIIGVVGRLLGSSNFDLIIELIMKFFDEAKTSVFRMWLGPILVIGLYDPKSVEIFLRDDRSTDKPFFYEYFNCKTALFATGKERWKSNRRLLSTAFAASTVFHRHLPYFNEKSHILVNRIKPHLNENSDLYRVISVFGMDLTIRTMMNVNMDLQSERGDQLYDIAKKIESCFQYRIPRIWLRYDFIYHNFSKVGRDGRKLLKYADDLFKEIYDKKVKSLSSQETDWKTDDVFLEKCLQLERQGIFSRENVLDEMCMIFIGATDTTAITIFGTLLLLAINQQHQDLVVEELRSIFESVDCDVTQAHLSAMNYTERVIKESLRLLPPGPFIARKTTGDIDLPNGTVPKDTTILISVMHMHRNPEVWGENVLEFDPDRFLLENIKKRPPYSYIPFSAGPRNCAGIKYGMTSVKTALAHLLRSYKFTTDLKFDDIQICMHIVLDFANDKPLRIEKRNF